jgi:perosamine synthetase
LATTRSKIPDQTTDFPEAIVSAIRTALSSPDGFVPLHEPRLGNLEQDYVKACIESTFVSSVGEYVDRFEHELAAYTGARHAIAVVNGTAALQVALLLAGVKAGDEVLVPSLTFVATANAVRYLGAEPHFVDCEESTLGIDPVALSLYLEEIAEFRDGFSFNKKSGRRIHSIVPVHIFGHPCQLEGILELSRKYSLQVVEDAAESLGSFYKERHTGTFGLLGTLSFNGNKTITTGGGGAILTNDSRLAKRAKHLTTTAKVPHRWEYVHDEVGFNYRMPNINAALGCAQLERLPDFLKSKQRLFHKYSEAFQSLEGVRILSEPNRCQSNFWLQTLLLDETTSLQRDQILEVANDAGFMMRPAWTPLHRLGPYADCPQMPLPVTEALERRILNLPSSSGLA